MKIEIGDNIAIVLTVVAVAFSLAYCVPQIKKVNNPEFKKCFVEETKDYPICHQKKDK